jgi:transposase
MKTTVAATFTDEDIYVGIDVHLKSWQVCICSSLGEYKTFSQNADAMQLIRTLKRTFPGARFQCAYEAGFSGFSLARLLKKEGIHTVVAHPPDIPTSDKDRRYKRNKKDARKLAFRLRKGELESIYIPTPGEEADRALLRATYQLTQKQTRVKNQIKGHLYFSGISLPLKFARCNWSGSFLRWLEELAASARLEPGAALALRFYLEELQHLRRLRLQSLRAIRARAATERYAEQVEYLCGLAGIGYLTAMVLLTEIMDIKRFGSLDSLASFAGLVPSCRGSGQNEFDGSITPRRSKQLRRVLIESAWVAARKDVQLMAAYHKLCRRMKKQKAIIRIARKQLARVHYILLNRKPIYPA